MKLSQLIESFVISNDEFEDYLNRATEQLAQELSSGKNARDAIHDLSVEFSNQHNKAYDAYVRMSDSLTARMHTLELDSPADMMNEPMADMSVANEPEMMTDPMGDMEMDTPADNEMPSDSDMEDYAAVMDNEPEVEESVNEAEERPYVCVHAKKGKHECHAKTSYEAAKKAAKAWGLKSTAGIDAHLAVEESVNEGRMSDQVIHDSETMSKEEFAKKHGKELADEMYEGAMDVIKGAGKKIKKAGKKVGKFFGHGEHPAFDEFEGVFDESKKLDASLGSPLADAAVIFTIFSTSSLAIAILGPAQAVLLHAGHRPLVYGAYLAASLLVVPMLVLVVPAWGGTGAALIVGTLLYAVQFALAYAARRKLQIDTSILGWQPSERSAD